MGMKKTDPRPNYGTGLFAAAASVMPKPTMAEFRAENPAFFENIGRANEAVAPALAKAQEAGSVAAKPTPLTQAGEYRHAAHNADDYTKTIDLELPSAPRAGR